MWQFCLRRRKWHEVLTGAVGIAFTGTREDDQGAKGGSSSRLNMTVAFMEMATSTDNAVVRRDASGISGVIGAHA